MEHVLGETYNLVGKEETSNVEVSNEVENVGSTDNESEEEANMTTPEETEVSNEVEKVNDNVIGNTKEKAESDGDLVDSSITGISNEDYNLGLETTLANEVTPERETQVSLFNETSQDKKNRAIIDAVTESNTDDRIKEMSNQNESTNEVDAVKSDIIGTEHKVIKEKTDHFFEFVNCEDMPTSYDGFADEESLMKKKLPSAVVKIEETQKRLNDTNIEDGLPGLILNGVFVKGALVNGLVVKSLQPLDNGMAVIRTKGEPAGVLQSLLSGSNEVQVQLPQTKVIQQNEHDDTLPKIKNVYSRVELNPLSVQQLEEEQPSTSNIIIIKKEQEIEEVNGSKNIEEDDVDNNSSLNLLRCCLCDFKTNKVHRLAKHVLIHSYKETTYSCFKCSFSTSVLRILRRHILIEHTNTLGYPTLNSETKFSKKFPRNFQENKPLPLLYKCFICGFTTSSPIYFRKHTVLHYDIIKKHFMCSICKFTTKNSTSLRLHEERHRSIKTFSCELCDYKTTKSLNCIRRHNLICHPDRFKNDSSVDIVCNLCSYKTNDFNALKIHLKWHDSHKKKS